MAKKDVLDETKMILEMMGEFEERVSLLREDLNQNSDFCQQIKDSLKKLRELRNQNTVELEDNQHLKDNIKNFNQQLLNFAQLIYQYNQELCSDLCLHDVELAKNEELLYKNKEMLKEKSNKYIVMQTTLTQQLELLKKEERDRIRKKELESKALATENEEMEAENQILNQKIEYKENYIKSEMAVLDDEKLSEKTIQDLQKSVQCRKNEIKQFSELLEEAKQLRQKLESEGEASLFNWDCQIKESEIEVKESSSVVDNCQLNIDEVSKKIEIVADQIKIKEEECNNYESEMSCIEANLKELEEDYNENIARNEKFFLENDGKYKRETEAQEQIKVDIRLFKNKIEGQQEGVEKILEFLAEHKTNENLHVELEEREEKKKQLKAAHQQLKKDYDKRVSELEAELNRGQEEIKAREQTNKKLQENTDALISELNQLKTEQEQMLVEKEQQNMELEHLENQIQNLNSEIEQTQAERLKNKKRAADTNIQTSQASSSSSKKRTRERHWDSDSSIEGEDRRLSDMVKRAMKLRKTAQTKIHK